MSGKEGHWSAGASRLRILASFAIVALHTMNVAEILYRDRITPMVDWLSMLPVHLLMWAVPIFVMVSGALLLDPAREITVEKIFKRYILRIVLALLIFVAFFRIFDLIMDKEPFSLFAAIGDSRASSFRLFTEVLDRLFTGGSWAHLWYLYLLIGLYLLLPAYRMVAKADEKTFRYLCIVGFVFLSLLSLTEIWGITLAFHIEIPAVYTLYFFLGYGIASGKISLKPEWGLFLFLGGTLFSLLMDVLLLRGFESISATLSSYANPGVVLQAVGLFAFIWPGSAKEKEAQWLRRLDATTFGIYLIHMVFLRLILRYGGFDPYRKGAYTFVLLMILVFTGSAAVTAFLRLIPGLKKIL